MSQQETIIMPSSATWTWGLLVPDEEFVERALCTVAQLGKVVDTKDRMISVSCFVGGATMPESLRKLESVCDGVVIRSQFRKTDLHQKQRLDSVDEFLLHVVAEAANFDLFLMFEKIAFLHPQIDIIQHADSAFDSKKGVLFFDIAGNWSVITVNPTWLLNPKPCNTLEEFWSKMVVASHHDGGGGGMVLQKIVEQKYLADDHPSTPLVINNSNGFIDNGDNNESRRNNSSWIAVVGMSCRLPQANSLEEYWAILDQGRNTASGPPPERADLCSVAPSVRANWLRCRVDHFDAEFFGVAPSEAEVMDPQCRLTLEVSWEALEDAGIKPEELRGSRTGVFYGSWLQHYRDLMNMECGGGGGGSSEAVDWLRKYMSNGFGCSAAKLSFFYGLGGPNIATESGCSSSMVAVELAVQSLARGECNLALAAGSNLILHWNEQKNVVWAPDGICKTFDAKVDGYGRAEGVGVLVLKRYSDALDSRDRIYGLICGSGVSQEGESPSFGSPTVKSESSAMKACLRSAGGDGGGGLSPADIDYIEAHGTGTAAGDPVEVSAIADAYYASDLEERCRRRQFPLYIASGKTNIGHTESCSGIAGLIKVLLSLQHESIPAHLNVSQLNPKLNFEELMGGGGGGGRARIPLQKSVPWPRNPARARVAAVSSFGITGTDVHMLLREAPERSPPAALPSSPPSPPSMMTVPHILCLSARSGPALEELTQRYLNHLEKQQDPTTNFRLLDMAYTANACRTPHALRRVITGRTKEELEAKIRAKDWLDGGGGGGHQKQMKRAGVVCFTFPGAIGQMEMAGARELYSSFPVFRTNMEKCEALFGSVTGGLSLLSALALEGLAHDHHHPVVVGPVERQAAVIAIQYSLAHLWASWGIRPAFVMGHCVGEVAAAMVAGVMSPEDGFKLVSFFQRFIELTPGGQSGEMLAVGADGPEVEQLIAEYHHLECGSSSSSSSSSEHQHGLELAALNSKSQTVVAGPSPSIQHFGAFCAERRPRRVACQRVPVDFPFHSSGIEGPLKACAREFIPEGFSTPAIPYISSVSGGMLGGGDGGGDDDIIANNDYWFRCFRNKVQFSAACATASTLGINVFLEIGLGSSLSKLTAENLVGSSVAAGGPTTTTTPPECVPSFRRVGGVVGTLAHLVALGVVGVDDIDWASYYQGHQVSKVPLPHYPFQRKPYWFKRKRHNNNNNNRATTAGAGVGCGSPQVVLHPLLGAHVSLAVRQQNIVTFENCLGVVVSTSVVELLRDHVIGDEVVFPAAGYLEMMLAGAIHDGNGDGDGDDDHFPGGTRRPPCVISIRNFSISAPLLLDNDSPESNNHNTTRMQTVVELEGSGSPLTEITESRKVSVFSERGGGGGVSGGGGDWRFHASGTVTSQSEAAAAAASSSRAARLDLKDIKRRLPLPPLVSDSDDGAPQEEFYKRLASVGLNFGQSFRSILSFAGNESEGLAEVQAPPPPPPPPGDLLLHDDYLLHPVLIDSMIQACFIHNWADFGSRLHVPVSISKFEMFLTGGRGRDDGDDECGCCSEAERRRRRFYVYIKHHHHHENPSSESRTRIVLADCHGATVAVMENPRFAPTSVASLMEAARGGGGGAKKQAGGGGGGSTLNTYEVVWERAHYQIPIHRPCVSGGGGGPPLLSPALAAIVEAYGGRQLSAEEQTLAGNIDRLCLLYVLNMLYEVGWGGCWSERAEVGPTQWLLADLLSALRVREPLAPAFSRYLDFLVEEGLMKWSEEEERERQTLTLTSAIPPPWESVKEEILETLELLQDYPALKVITACGSNLRAALQGEVSGQFILFGKGEGEDDSRGGGGDSLAETYYSTNKLREEERAAVRDVFEELCRELLLLRETPGRGREQPSEPIRILEVGAGTGSFSRVALTSLSATTIPFEYHFTDISPAYFEGAMERFKEHQGGHIAYKTLDIEKDPLAQGFPPGYFDIVVGVDVFHATSFLRQTIRHAGLLLRPGGTLLIGETERPVREIDIIFGTLSGYWAFQDSDLRDRHCVVGAETWEQVLKQVGFSETLSFLSGGGQNSVIVGRKKELDDRHTSSSSSLWTTDDDDARQRQQLVNNPRHRRWLAIGEHDFPADFDKFVRRLRDVGRDCHFVTLCSSSSSSEEEEEELMGQLIKAMEEEEEDDKKGVVEGILVVAAGRRREEKRRNGFEQWQDRRGLLKALFTTCKLIGQRRVSPLPRLALVTTGTWASGHEGDLAVLDPSAGALWGLARSVKMEIPQLGLKCIDLDPVAAGSSSSSSSSYNTEQMERVLLTEMWLDDDKETDVLHRQGVRYVRRLRAEKKRPQRISSLEFPLSTTRFEVALPGSRAIADLRFVPKKEEAGGAELSGQQIEVEMKSASLNFRDVLIVMKPAGSIFESMSVLGFDYAGVVTRVGPRAQRLQVGQPVYGLSTGESTISSHIITEESHGIRIPPGLTFAEAATLPAVFLTVWYSMVEVARVKPGQTVLVHAVTGGVGLAAIQVGRILGVEVLGTAGSPRKRNFARASLGLTHVFNSRDLSFGAEVSQVTGGAGVDMVLNCLTGPGFKEASLELVKDGGHFVELSKLDVWSEEEVRSRRPGVHYKLVWLPQVRPELISQMMAKMNELVEEESGRLAPLPSTRFPASQLPSALSTLQRAKHIGKVIVDLPSFHPQHNRLTEQLFGGSNSNNNNDRTYLITGGMGAIGLAVARWMVASQGARHLVLVGRSQPGSQAALEAIRQLRDEFKATVVCRQADISSYDQCKALLEDLFTGEDPLLPPLAGIHHCAGILTDKLLVNQDWAEFESVLKPKADGLYNLHRLTATAAHPRLPPLEFFVAHSSMSSTMGNVGQTNYAAGNAYMDALMEARVETGLKGLVINWGQWKAGLAENVEMRVAIPFSIQEGIAALERFFVENKTSIVAGRFRFPELMKMYPGYSGSFLKALMMASSGGGGEKTKREAAGGRGGNNAKVVPFLVQYNNKQREEGMMTEEEKDRLIAGFVRNSVCSILGLGNEEIEDNAEFSTLGMDSLMSIDFTNKLQSELPGVDLGYIDMAEFGSVVKMGAFISRLIK